MRVFLMIACLFTMVVNAAKKDTPVDLTLSNLDGKRVHLRDARGHAVVLNFWATWCVPCRAELPLLVAAEMVWREKGVTFIGASLDEKESRKTIPAFLEKFHIGFPVWVGSTGDDLARMGVGEAVPGTAFLDERGIVFGRILGQMREGEIDERLRWVTGDRSQPAPATLVSHLGK